MCKHCMQAYSAIREQLRSVFPTLDVLMLAPNAYLRMCMASDMPFAI